MSGIGDLLLITPALRAVHRIYPAAVFDIVTYNLDHGKFLFRLPFVNGGVVFPLFDLELKHFWRPTFWRRFLKTVLTLRRKRYDIYISFHHTWMPQWFFLELLLAALSGATFRMGINPDYVSNDGVFDRSINEADLGDRHFRDFYLDLIRLIGKPIKENSMAFPIRDTETAAARALLRSSIPNLERIVCLHIGASTASKRWPVENYLQLARLLIESGCGIVLIGTENERALCARVEKHVPVGSVLNTAGQTDIFLMASLIEGSDLFIGNDSGPMHIAIARKKPTIGLIGPYHPRYHKYEKSEAAIIRNPVTNHAYDAIAFKESDYPWQIPVNQVFAEAMNMLI